MTAKTQRWGVVGGGFLGMMLAHRLATAGHAVTLFEAAPQLGGLASAWQLGPITWDRHYHVILMSDLALRGLLGELGLDEELVWKETRTGFYVDGTLHSMSNTLEFLRFPPLNPFEKLRLGATIFYASRIKNWRRLEKIPVTDWLRKWSGTRTFEKIWLPLLKAKLGENYDKASAAFIWAIIARMYAARRTGLKKEMFGYVRGGYAKILARFAEKLRSDGVTLRTGCPIHQVTRNDEGLCVETEQGNEVFDKVVVTSPAPVAARLCPQLKSDEKDRLSGILYQGIICASLLMKEPLADYYVTNITDSWVPFTAVIETSALVDRSEFGGHCLVYLPKYVVPDDPAFNMSDEQIREQFLAALNRMYPNFRRENVLAFQVSRVKHVLAISTLNYSQHLPSMQTSVRGLWVVNSAHIVNGTLNVNETVQLAERALPLLLAGPNRRKRLECIVMAKPLASLSLDLDNKWSYMKTHGDAGWESWPSYLPLVVPRVLDFLRQRSLAITFFIVGQDAVQPENQGVLADIGPAGHEIGNHSFRHEPWLHLYSESEIEAELAQAEESIASATGVRPHGFRGPGFSLSPTVLRVLARRGYHYDASTFPTFLGPLARLYYFFTAKLTPEQKAQRKQLFGNLSEGFKPLQPYRWRLPEGSLPEVPVTTFPGLRVPIHVSYLLYLARFSSGLARTYWNTALRWCRWANVPPSLLLHPLDFLGAEDVPELAFFPAMDQPAERKLRLVGQVIDQMTRWYEVLPLDAFVRRHDMRGRMVRRP